MKSMSMQLFPGRQRDAIVYLSSRKSGGARTREPIAAAGRVLLCFRVCFLLEQERSTKSHETAGLKSVFRHVFSWIVLPGERQSLKKGRYPFSYAKARACPNLVVAVGR